MATIEKYQTASGATLYAVRYRQPNNKQTWKRGFTRKRDAQFWLSLWRAQKSAGEHYLAIAYAHYSGQRCKRV